MNKQRVSRRRALGGLGAIVAGSVAGSAFASQAPSAAPTTETAPPLLPYRDELVNTLEFEPEAKRKLAPGMYALIAGGDRDMFERVTLWPRMPASVMDLDLSLTLLGEAHFAPIIVGPVSEQKRFHPDGELATAKGATAAKALMVVSSRSSAPLAQIASEARSFWYQVYASDAAARTQIAEGVKSGAKGIVITVGASPATGAMPVKAAAINWGAVDRLKEGVDTPVLIKGVSTAAEATAALQHNVQGVIVSNFGGMLSNKHALILELPKIVDTVAGKAPVLVDGSFRRGTDVLKALAFGAQAVLVSRPVMWGLAAYGADGVQGVFEMLQTELARYMGMCGKSNLKMLDRTLVKVHRAAPAAGASG